jgi:hypothetical protein
MEYEVSRAHSTHGEKDYIEDLVGKLEGNISLGGRLILKWILEK